ncbi:Na+/H+ antiporter subunit E [Nitrincola sp. MINF-07-Sa-05]|uniref:Na+/H+ antiporter subunit E n=1 Tax=Nitrincola salilacus TaxID=3400273 RepID=UPI0039182ED5
MNRFTFWLPRPIFTLFLAVLWLFLVNSFSVAQVLLGLGLGILIPFSTRRFWPEPALMHHPLLLLRYFLVLLWDIICSNLIVARRIIGRVDQLSPGFITYPVELVDEFAITLLASTISLTPGTVTSHYDTQQGTLLIHVLHIDDERALIEQIRTRYEKPLKEIFQ